MPRVERRLGATCMLIPRNAVIVDTNVMSYAIRRAPIARDYERLLIGRRMHVSFITVGELHFWAKKDGWGSTRCTQLRQSLSNFPIVPFIVRPNRRRSTTTCAYTSSIPLLRDERYVVMEGRRCDPRIRTVWARVPPSHLMIARQHGHRILTMLTCTPRARGPARS
jgi:PIN domain